MTNDEKELEEIFNKKCSDNSGSKVCLTNTCRSCLADAVIKTGYVKAHPVDMGKLVKLINDIIDSSAPREDIIEGATSELTSFIQSAIAQAKKEWMDKMTLYFKTEPGAEWCKNEQSQGKCNKKGCFVCGEQHQLEQDRRRA
jgi:hypothetical protein